MLQKLRDQTQGTGFKILVGAIIVVLTLFGFGATSLFSGADPELANVGDFDITQNLLAAETERERRRLLTQMGPDFDPSNIDRLQLQQYVLQQLINRQVLYQATEGLGLSVDPDTVNAEIIGSPAYQIDGTFNEAIYRQQVQALGYSPVTFLEEFTAALSSDQLRSAVVDTTMMPDWELAEIVRVINQRRDLAYLPLTVERYRERVDVSDDEVTLRYNEDQSAYMTELAVDVSYLKLSANDLQQDTQIEVSESELQGLYEEDRATALADEQRDSSHILIQVNDDREAAQALTLATEIQTRLAEGESFETLAEELSDDPGSAQQGGALGAVGKGIFDPEYENALWSLTETNEVSSPVLSSFGYHLIRLNAIVEREYPAFDLERGGLELRVRQSKAQDLFTDRALELERAAYEERYSLDGTGQSMGLEVHTVAHISRGLPGEDPVLAKSQVLDALFSNDVLNGTNSDALELADDEIVIVRVNEQYAPEPIPLAEVTETIKQTIEREKALAAIEEAKVSGLARLSAGDSAVDIAEELGSAWQTFELATRVDGTSAIPPQVLTTAFDLPRPTAGQKAVGIAELDDGAALVTVTRVRQGDINTTADAEVAELRRVSESRASRMDFQSFFQAAEEDLGVTRPAG
jgi:peptidyl-prolyl cis-trans isomerase D